MAVFVRVAELGSFAAAAKELRLSPTMIGKHMRHLEQRLGALLINRSTRRQSLTELGRNYVDHCRHVLEEIEAGEALAEEAMRTPRGRLRVGAPLSFGCHALAPALVPFMKRYPEIAVELSLSDRMVDLADEGIDVAIRVGPLIDSTMMARSPRLTSKAASKSTTRSAFAMRHWPEPASSCNAPICWLKTLLQGGSRSCYPAIGRCLARATWSGCKTDA